jgi:tetratricopeptide (TPR) repeat protein
MKDQKKFFDFLEVIKRAESGEMMKEADYDKKLGKKTLALMKQFEIRYDPNSVIPTDDGLADRVYQAAVDLFLDLGVYCTDTQRVIRFTKEDNAAARQWAQKAVELDPKFAGGWAQLGWTHLWDVMFGWTLSPVQSMERALECGQKAIGLSDSSAKAYALMGYINLLNRKFDEAIENGERLLGSIPTTPLCFPSWRTLCILMENSTSRSHCSRMRCA